MRRPPARVSLVLLSGLILWLAPESPAVAFTDHDDWTFYLSPGLVLGGTTRADVALASNGAPLRTFIDQDQLGPSIRLEALVKIPDLHIPDVADVFLNEYSALTLELDGVPYNTAGEGKSDRQFEIGVTPRGQFPIGPWVPWVGLELGLRFLSVTSRARTDSGLTFTSNSPSAGLALTPRLGTDFEMDRYSLGIGLAWIHDSHTLTGTTVDSVSSISAPTTVKQSRSWWELSLRLGFKL